jgi:hypothetical protein
MSGWYQQGFDAVDKLPDVSKQNRFWLKVGEERQIVFLDKDPFTFWEHQVRLNGEWRYYFTCLKNLNKPCPLCDAKVKRYFVGLFSIIDVSSYIAKDGKEVKNPVKLMAIKQKALKLLKRHDDKGRILHGLFNVVRTDDKAGTSGDMFEFEQKVNPLEYNPKATVFDYEKECKPLEHEALATIASMAEPDPYANAGKEVPVAAAVADDSDNVPF